MIKMVASDLDGTLLVNGRQSIPEEIFPLIKKLKDMGILFVAASGRQYANMRNLFAPVKDDMAFIGENGGLAIQNEKLLYCDSFDKKLVMEIIEAIQEKKGRRVFLLHKRFLLYHAKNRALPSSDGRRSKESLQDHRKPD